MTWAFKRQLIYLGIFVALLLFFGFLVIYPNLNKAPTCVDNKQNGDETGIDCGGSCPRACIFEVDQISILWSRAFRVVPGRYNAIAYLENHNENTAINKINYRFRFADKDNIYIGKRDGEAYIPPSGKFVIFEPAIDVGNSIPIYTTFEFTEEPLWIQVSEEKINQVKVLVSDINLENQDTSPRLTAVVKNNSLFQIPEVSVISVLYDESGNAVSSSRTYLDKLDGEESKEVTFTWPEPIAGDIVAKEIIPIYNIFSVKLK
ncbi:FxLYD domain-containing protein [Patescibacteria group bacterium]|nr:FxLYD domain-containing protein [Patescibacteria group bacterium]